MSESEIPKIEPGRLGLNVPYEWWPASPLLKEIEASGFGWVQVPSPPSSVLADTRQCVSHAAAVRRSLATTDLRAILHAPGAMMAGEQAGDRLLESTISYAAESGCEQIVYHAMALADQPGAHDRLAAEASSLDRLAELANRLGLVIAVENLAPVFPGPERLSAVPATLRSLVAAIGSPGLRLCLDVGHANVVAGLRQTGLERLVDPVLDSVSLFHVHDNLGGRRLPADRRPGLDPLRLDLHLPQGRGSLEWARISAQLLSHEAPLMLEIHPPHRPSPRELAGMIATALSPRSAPLAAPAAG